MAPGDLAAGFLACSRRRAVEDSLAAMAGASAGDNFSLPTRNSGPAGEEALISGSGWPVGRVGVGGVGGVGGREDRKKRAPSARAARGNT